MRVSGGFSRAVWGAAAAAALWGQFGLSTATAASGVPSREQLNPAQRSAPAASAAPSDLFTSPVENACPLAGSDVRVTLRSVVLRGATAPAAEFAPLYADLVGIEGPVANVCAVRDRVSEALFRRGILARVEIPEQRIADGVLTLEVIEARIVSVRVRGDAGGAGPLIERYADHLRGMAPFDLDKAQRYILLISDIPGVQVRASLRPSATAQRGAVDLDLTVSYDPVAAVVNVHNLQSKIAGPWGALGRIDFRSLTPLGENTSLVAYRTFQNEQWVVQGLEEVRLGGDGLIGRLSLAYGESRPGDILKPLNLKNKSFVGNVEAAYPLLRKRRLGLTIAGGLDWIDQTAGVKGIGKVAEDNLRVAYARVEGEARPQWVGRPVLLTGQVSLRKGVSALGGSKKGDVSLIRAGDPEALVFDGSLSLLAAATDWLTLSARLDAQYSSYTLLSYEQLPVGNLTIGRGYDPSSVTGDSGVAGAFEARFRQFSFGRGITAAPYAFYDVAHVKDNDALKLRRTVMSAGAGLQLKLGRRAAIDAVYAHPFDATFPGAPRPSDRVLVNLSISLF